LRYWTNTNCRSNVLKVNLDLVEVGLCRSLLQLQIELLEHLLVLDGTLIQLLLDANLANSFVSYIVKLCEKKVVNALVTIILHERVETSNLLLELDDFVHEFFADLFVPDLDHLGLILVHRFVQLLNKLIDLLAIILVLLLQFLNVVEETLLGEL
jgi:hypothetical protein